MPEEKEKIGTFVLVMEAIIQFLGWIIVCALVAGFGFSLFYLMGAASTIEVLRYGFATVAFAVLVPTIAVSYRRKS